MSRSSPRATGSTTLDQRPARRARAAELCARGSTTGTCRATSPLAYDVAADVHGYATYARSFKSGGINLSGLPLDAANNADPGGAAR